MGFRPDRIDDTSDLASMVADAATQLIREAVESAMADRDEELGRLREEYEEKLREASDRISELELEVSELRHESE